MVAIDYGEKRCGLAWTDPLGLFATALPGVMRTELDATLARLVPEGPVFRIILGYPTRLDGSDTHSTQAVRQYAAKLRQQYPDIPLHLLDERFTSSRAQQALLDGGANRKKRQDKHLIDSISAVLLLQDFLSAPTGRYPAYEL